MAKSVNIVTLILMLSGMLLSFKSKAQDYYDGGNKPYKPEKNDHLQSGGEFSIAVSLGSASPSKSFSSTNIKNSFWDFNSSDSVKLQGFAKTGINFNVTASYLFPDGLGVRLMIGSNTNAFDINTFTSTVGVPFTSTDVYHTREYLIGPFFSFSEGPKFKFEANAMIGLVTANYPAIAIAVVDTTETIAFNPGRGFGYSIGGAVKYNLTKKIDIAVDISYTETKIVYSGWTDSYSVPGYYPYVIPHSNDIASMPMGILKLTAGLVFKFN